MMRRRLVSMIIAVSLCTAMSAQQIPVLHYDFSRSGGAKVTDVSGNGQDGTLCGSARLVKHGWRNVVDLGNDGGYIDMGPGIGSTLAKSASFTVAVRYLVKEEASLQGNGYFLWAFSTRELNSKTEGRYHAYKLNVQRSENSVGGWTRETIMDIGKPADKGEWQYAVYTQDGTFGRLYLNGRLVAFNNDMFTMARTFSDEGSPAYNWIGRAPFPGDAYLAGTLISDVRVYTSALSDREVRCLSNELQREDLTAHDFLFCGESKERRIFKISDGKIVWRYDNAAGRGELSDTILLDDGHILITDQFGAAELDENGKELWRIPAPEGTEIHTIQPIGTRYVVYIVQDLPAAKVVVRRLSDMKVVKQFDIPVSQEGLIHFQFRCARLTSRGTLLVAHMGDGGITEWDSKGRMVARWDIPGPWGVCELENGDILAVSNRNYVRQFKRSGEVVWEQDLSRYGCTIPQKAYRLKNGNTVITNWFSEWDDVAMASFDSSNPPLQIVEIDPQGRLVWQMASWDEMGPATTFQPLDEPIVRSNCFFGKYK